MNFIDFCAGIGGGKLGLEAIGYIPVGFSEIDKNAIDAYRIIHNDDSINFDDLTKIESDFLPNFDLLIGGFPCQTFSIIGERCGLDDCDRGEIIYYIANILEEKEIKYFILENVKGLVNHDKGRTLKIVLELLQNIGYEVYYKILNSIDFGVPQLRERVYFVGIRKDLTQWDNFEFPTPTSQNINIEDFLIDESKEHLFDIDSISFNTFQKYLNNKYNIGKFDLNELLKQEYLVLDTRQSDLRLYKNKVPTIRKGRQGILYVKNGKLRKLSGFEAMLLQGFPIDLAQKAKENISNSKLLALSGNAMTVSVITQIAKKLEDYIKNQLHQ